MQMPKEEPKEIEYCDACGIPMTDESGSTVMGMSIQLEGDHAEIRRVKSHFGKTSFKVCYVCWIRSLGIKEVINV